MELSGWPDREKILWNHPFQDPRRQELEEFSKSRHGRYAAGSCASLAPFEIDPEVQDPPRAPTDAEFVEFLDCMEREQAKPPPKLFSKCEIQGALYLAASVACIGGGVWYGYRKAGGKGAVIGGAVGAVPGVPLLLMSMFSGFC